MGSGDRRRRFGSTAYGDAMVALSVLLGVAVLFWITLFFSTGARPWHYPDESIGITLRFWGEGSSFTEQPLIMFTVTLTVLTIWLFVLFVTIFGRKGHRLPDRVALGAGIILIAGMAIVTDDLIDMVTARYRLDKWEGTPFGAPLNWLTPPLKWVYVENYDPKARYWAQIGEEWVFLPDADTLRLGNNDYRLWGIDALQTEQICVAENKDEERVRCGEQAREAFLKLMTSVPPSEIACRFPDQAVYPRTISCRAGRQDVAEWLVRHGHAFPAREGRHRYREALGAAKAQRAGAWATTFLFPGKWKAARCELFLGVCRRYYGAD